jgi:hypothetical protein
MSRQDFRGASYAFSVWMQQAADEIAAGKTRGVRVLHKHPDRKRTHIGWLRRQLLSGEFRKRG